MATEVSGLKCRLTCVAREHDGIKNPAEILSDW